MDLMLTADQEAIAASVRGFLDKELPIARVRELASKDGSAYAPVWRGAAALGFFGLGLSETKGGAGYTITEEMVLLEELGRTLAPGPWLGTLLAAHSLATSQAPAAGAALERILAGDLRVALAEGGRGGGPLEVRNDTLSGRRTYVSDAAVANAFLILDEVNGSIFVDASANSAAIRTEVLPSFDPTRSLANVEFHAAPCQHLGSGAETATNLRRRATILSCAEAVGGIARTVEMSVEYAKVRHQFDKPIGSFQAVKHRCSDMAVRAEVARSATIYATVSVRDSADDADFQTAVAKILCANAYLANSADNVQNHGGMGFTWECDAHLFVKRARSFDLTLGTRTEQLDRIVKQFRNAA